MLCSGLPGPGRITVPFAATLPIPTAHHASQRPETRLPRTRADFRTWLRRCAPRFPAAPEIQAPIHRAEILITLRTSAVAFGVWRRHLTAAPPTLERRFMRTP